MGLIQRFEAGNSVVAYSPALQENYNKVDEIRDMYSPVSVDDDITACTATAIEAFSKGQLLPRYSNEYGMVKSITGPQEIGPLLRKELVLRSNGEVLYLGRIGLLGGAPIDELERKLQNKASNTKSVFISYQGDQKDIAKDIQEEFERRGFLVIRDEMRIINHPNLDYVVTIVSESYLKSKSCMNEVDQILKRYKFSDTLLPIVMADVTEGKVDIYNGIEKCLVHWRSKLTEARSMDDRADEEVIQNIIKNCQTFATTVGTKINVPEDELRSQHYQPFFDLIVAKEKEGNVSKEIDELLIKSAKLEKMKSLSEAEKYYISALEKIHGILHLEGTDPLYARVYGAYSEFLTKQNKSEEAQHNLEIAKNFGYQAGSSSSNSNSVVASLSPTPVLSNSNNSNSNSVAAAEKASLLLDVEVTPSEFVDASKVMKTEEDLKALVNAFAFGKDKWEKYFGSIYEAEPALPHNIVEILCSADPYNPQKTVAETHMLFFVPTKVNRKRLNLVNFRELVKAPRDGNKSDYKEFWKGIEREHGTTQSAQAQWVLMTKDVIPESRNKAYEKQKQIVEAKLDYEVPNLLSVTVGILSYYVRTGERLFSDNQWSFTRCKETMDEKGHIYHLLVGGLASDGLVFTEYRDPVFDKYIGVAALRKL